MKPVHRLVPGACAALLCASAPASEHIVDIAWASGGTFSHAATVAPGKFLEACGRLDAGDRIGWTFAAAAPLDFNIHYHVGQDAVFPARLRQAASGDGLLEVAVAQDYCWMWTNKGRAPARVTLELKR